jgi:hypothetical protein
MALIDKKLTELTEILSVPDNAFIHVVDPNDVSQSPQGSSYKAKKSTIGGAVKAQVTVSGTVKVDSNNADPIVYLKSKVDALLAEKQDTLVNTVNIASINGQNLLNGGNIETANTIPTLQNVLDNNNDLIGGKNFQGTDAGNGNTGFDVNALGGKSAFLNTGNNVNALGYFAGFSNTGTDINAFGSSAAESNSGTSVNALGGSSAFNNSGSYVNALGQSAGVANAFNNINLFGRNTQADENGQTVFGKTSTIFARLSTLLLTATRKYILPNQSGTIALESYVDAQITSNTGLNVINEPNANRTAVLSDANSFIAFTLENTAKTYTIPLNSSVPFSIGTRINLRSSIAGNLNVSGSVGVNFFAFDGFSTINGGIISIIKTAVNTWNVNILPSFGLVQPSNLNISLGFVTTTFLNAGRVLTTKIGVSGYPDNFEINAVDDGVRRWVSKNILRYETNLPILNSLDLTPKSYVDAKLNPTLNVLPKKGASGFVDSQIFDTGAVVSIGNPPTNFLAKFQVDLNRAGASYTAPDANAIMKFFNGVSTGVGIEMGVRLGAQTIAIIQGTNSSSTFDLAINAYGGNLGINQLAPTEKLDVIGNIKLSNLLKLGQFTTATEPAYVKGAQFFNTTLNKMRIGGATAYETVTSS